MRPSAVRTLQTWRLEQCSAAAGRRFEEQCGRRSFPGLEEQRRRVELPRRGEAAPAGGPSGGEEQSRRVDLQAGAASGSGKRLGGSYPSRVRPQLFPASRARRHARALPQRPKKRPHSWAARLRAAYSVCAPPNRRRVAAERRLGAAPA